METRYLVYPCPNCNTFIGQHFLVEYLIDVLYGNYKYKIVDIK